MTSLYMFGSQMTNGIRTMTANWMMYLYNIYKQITLLKQTKE